MPSGRTDEPADTFGKRLAQARREYACRTRKDLSPAALAVALEVSPATVYRWEDDEKRPSPANLDKLAALLGVTRGFLLFGERTAGVNPELDEEARRRGAVELKPATARPEPEPKPEVKRRQRRG